MAARGDEGVARPGAWPGLRHPLRHPSRSKKRTPFGGFPAYVNDIAEEERIARVELASDQCVIDGEHFFILGNLDIPIIGYPETLRWSVWTSLSQKNFERASELWSTSGREQESPYFGWLSNWIPVYEASTLNLKTFVHTQPVGLRPKIQVLECDHELFREQQDGISLERAELLIHRALHG